MRSFPSLTTAALTAWLLASPHVCAQSICDTGPYQDRLADRYGNEACLKENAALTKRGNAALNEKYDNDVTWSNRAREQLGKLMDEIQKRPSEPDLGAQGRALSQNLREAIVALGGLPDLDSLSDRPRYRVLQVDYWKPSARPSAIPAGLAAQHLTDAGCMRSEGSDPKCQAAYQRAVTLGDDIYVATAIVSRLHDPQAQKFEELATLRRDRWHSYLYDTQFQYWWELALNRYLEEKCPAGHRQIVALIDRQCVKQSRDAFDNPLGFREPPRSRTIFLHPDIGLQYIDAEAQGDRLKAALVVQWFGYQWWEWKGSKVDSLRGLSLVSTLSDNASTKPLGWGAQVQINQYAVAFTSHDGKLAVTLNLQLGDKMSKLNEEWADKLKRLKD